MPVADEHDRVGAQRDELADAQTGAQTGAQQDFADHADQQPALSLGGAQELRRVGVIQGLFHPQAEDFAAAQPAQDHRLEHRPVPVGARCGEQCVDLGGFQHSRQRPRTAHQRHCLPGAGNLTPGRQPSRHGVGHHVTPGGEIEEQPGDRRQSTADRAGADPRRVTDRAKAATITAAALGGDEREHIRAGDLTRFLRDEAEEYHHVVAGREDRVRSGTTSEELQIVVQKRHAHAHHEFPGRGHITLQTGFGERHSRVSISTGGGPQRPTATSMKITRISSSCGRPLLGSCERSILDMCGRPGRSDRT